ATALALAVRSADVDVARFLVEKGLDPGTLSPAARRAGVARNDLPTADYLFSKAPSPAQDLLGTVATWQPVSAVARWIEAGGGVETRPTEPNTPATRTKGVDSARE